MYSQLALSCFHVCICAGLILHAWLYDKPSNSFRSLEILSRGKCTEMGRPSPHFCGDQGFGCRGDQGFGCHGVQGFQGWIGLSGRYRASRDVWDFQGGIGLPGMCRALVAMGTRAWVAMGTRAWVAMGHMAWVGFPSPSQWGVRNVGARAFHPRQGVGVGFLPLLSGGQDFHTK